MKYLQVNLTKEVKDLYSENFSTLKTEIRVFQIREWYYFLTDRKNQHCENVNILTVVIKYLCISDQNSTSISHISSRNIPKIHLKPAKT